jgi:hypothetical protein
MSRYIWTGKALGSCHKPEVTLLSLVDGHKEMSKQDFLSPYRAKAIIATNYTSRVFINLKNA